MSMHPSLKIDPAAAQQRSVLSRIERIKDLMKKGSWSENQMVTGLPKTRITRLKTKKAAKVVAADGAAGEVAGAPAAAGAKPAAAGAKPAAAKPGAAPTGAPSPKASK